MCWELIHSQLQIAKTTYYKMTSELFSSFLKVQWQYFTNETDMFVVLWCESSLGFHKPKIINIGRFLLKKMKGTFLDTLYSSHKINKIHKAIKIYYANGKQECARTSTET